MSANWTIILYLAVIGLPLLAGLQWLLLFRKNAPFKGSTSALGVLLVFAFFALMIAQMIVKDVWTEMLDIPPESFELSSDGQIGNIYPLGAKKRVWDSDPRLSENVVSYKACKHDVHMA